jgi:hypothetical protein
VDSRQLPCPTCADVTDFVQPPCLDGHTEDGGECPEWICVDCDTALVLGGLSVAPAVVRARIAA